MLHPPGDSDISCICTACGCSRPPLLEVCPAFVIRGRSPIGVVADTTHTKHGRGRAADSSRRPLRRSHRHSASYPAVNVSWRPRQWRVPQASHSARHSRSGHPIAPSKSIIQPPFAPRCQLETACQMSVDLDSQGLSLNIESNQLNRQRTQLAQLSQHSQMDATLRFVIDWPAWLPWLPGSSPAGPWRDWSCMRAAQSPASILLSAAQNRRVSVIPFDIETRGQSAPSIISDSQHGGAALAARGTSRTTRNNARHGVPRDILASGVHRGSPRSIPSFLKVA